MPRGGRRNIWPLQRFAVTRWRAEFGQRRWRLAFRFWFNINGKRWIEALRRRRGFRHGRRSRRSGGCLWRRSEQGRPFHPIGRGRFGVSGGAVGRSRGWRIRHGMRHRLAQQLRGRCVQSAGSQQPLRHAFDEARCFWYQHDAPAWSEAFGCMSTISVPPSAGCEPRGRHRRQPAPQSRR